MKNKAWLALLVLPLMTACGTEKPTAPKKPITEKTIEQENAEILKNIKIELPEVTSGEYKTVGETGETYSDPNRIQLGESAEDVLNQMTIEEN